MRLFNVETDLSDINSWLIKHEVPTTSVNDLPVLGYIIPNVAVGFLRMVEGGFAQIDGLTTNPEKESIERDKAIDLIVSQLIDSAKALQVKGIYSFSIDKNTILRSKKYGFTTLKHTLMVCDLSKKV